MTIRQRDLERISDRELLARMRREAEKGEARTIGQRTYRDSLEAELEARDLLQRIDR